MLVDRVCSITDDLQLTAIKNVTVNEPFFQGHFPVRPVMPGVMMLEALAQAAGFLILYTEDVKVNDELYFLASIEQAKFKRVVEPGDQLLLEVELLKKKKKAFKFRGRVTVEGQLACEAVFMNIKAPQS